MKLGAAYFLFGLCCSVAFAQPRQLPDILKPDLVAEAEAQRMGAKVFKLLPGGMFVQPPNTYTDRENPLGVRDGGAYYSFTAGSHSANDGPVEIFLYGGSGRLASARGGRNYGFFADLGPRDLSGLASAMPEAKFFLLYKPPLFEKEAVKEYESLREKRVDGLTIVTTVDRPIAGNSYLMRAISFQQADILLAFQIVKIGKDGSITIAWKKLADFEKPRPLLYMTDEDLKQRVDSVISGLELRGIEVVVRDNTLILNGANTDIERLKDELKARGVEFRGIVNLRKPTNATPY